MQAAGLKISEDWSFETRSCSSVNNVRDIEVKGGPYNSNVAQKQPPYKYVKQVNPRE